MGRSLTLGALLICGAVAGIAWLSGAFSRERDVAAREPGVVADDQPAAGLPGESREMLTAAAGTSTPAPSAPSRSGEREIEEARKLDREFAEFRTILARPKGERTDLTDLRRKELLATLRSLAAHLDPALDLVERLEREEDAVLGIRLGRALRRSPYPEVGAALAAGAVESSSAIARRGALIALEGRPHELWWKPVTSAFGKDTDPDVRTEAAQILARSMNDRRFLHQHADVRRVLQAGLQSADPLQRERALTALMTDRTAGEAEMDAIRPLLRDEDERVRREAAAALRVLEPRAEAARKRRAGG